MRGFSDAVRGDWEALPRPSGSPSRNCRTTGHDAKSFEKLTRRYLPIPAPRKTYRITILVLELGERLAEPLTLDIQACERARQAPLAVRRQSQMSDAGVLTRRRAL